MRTSTSTLFLLASTFTLAVACDDASESELAADGDDDVALRCVGSSCTPPPTGNTSRIGDHAVSNMSKTIGADAANSSATIRITGATGKHLGIPRTVTQIDVEPDGELKLQLGTIGWIGGEAVEEARFNITVSPTNGDPSFSGTLRIAEANCDPGLLDDSMTICRYDFVTDVVPADEVLYPENDKFAGWYHVCPDDDEDGTLPEEVKFSSVLSPNVTLAYSPLAGPSVAVSAGKFINGCLNGAVSKGQYKLNAFYDATAYRGLDPSQRTPMLLMWMAWHDGGSRTVPGKLISPHDPIGGLFTWTGALDWSIEGGYGLSGATCRGGSMSTGVHRNYSDPIHNLVNWANLPHCTPTTLTDYAVLGVKVHDPNNNAS